MIRKVLIMADAKREYFSSALEMFQANEIHYEFGNPLLVSEEELIAQAAEFQAVIAGSERWSEAVIKSLKELRLIVRCGTGYDGVNVPAAAKHGIWVVNTPGLNTYAVAEMAMAMILVLMRKLKAYDYGMQNRKWEPQNVCELRKKTIGLVGFGGVAKQLAFLLQPFQCRILAYDIYEDIKAAEELGVFFVTLEELLKESDVISLHLPLIKETAHLIRKETIGKMKEGCIVVNTSRGGIICTKDLLSALQSGHIAGAALDVHETEPIPEKYELAGLENVILTPHVASATKETTINMIHASAKAVLRYFKKEKPENLIMEVMDETFGN